MAILSFLQSNDKSISTNYMIMIDNDRWKFRTANENKSSTNSIEFWTKYWEGLKYFIELITNVSENIALKCNKHIFSIEFYLSSIKGQTNHIISTYEYHHTLTHTQNTETTSVLSNEILFYIKATLFPLLSVDRRKVVKRGEVDESHNFGSVIIDWNDCGGK